MVNRVAIDYLVSRFPVISETFIVRELDTLAQDGGYDGDIGLRSLFASPDPEVHDIARRWTSRLARPNLRAAALGLGWAVLRHPLITLAVVGAVVRGYAAKPTLLVRALVTIPLAAAHARDLSRSDRPRHVHAHYATYPALAAWICARLIGVTYSITVHAHDLYVDQSMLATKIEGARFVATVSEYNRAILNRINESDTPIEVVHCGIRSGGYTYRPREIPRDGRISALCVASLQEYKGHAVLLRALALGGDDVDRIDLDLIGNGPLEHSLRDLAATLGLADRVRFHGGQSETFVKAALDRADLFVLPSVVAADGQMEGLPVALMEALACGVPTVATNLSGIPEIVVPGVTGLLATPGDATSLRDAIAEMVALGSAVDKFVRAGRELVEREFDDADATRALVRLFDELG
jgi:glycosyltransferase involved in cell wall biosynthesis